MGVSTVLIGLLPTYSSIGVAAPLLLALCRFGQGLGLGGEWGGAVLLAIENAPPGKRALVRHVPAARRADRLLPVVRRLLAAAALHARRTQFVAWGWRVPFVASSCWSSSACTCA